MLAADVARCPGWRFYQDVTFQCPLRHKCLRYTEPPVPDHPRQTWMMAPDTIHLGVCVAFLEAAGDKTHEWVRRAMDKAIDRVRLKNASIRLPTTQFPDDDTDAIREAMKLYVETWIVPMLEAVRDGKQREAEAWL